MKKCKLGYKENHLIFNVYVITGSTKGTWCNCISFLSLVSSGLSRELLIICLRSQEGYKLIGVRQGLASCLREDYLLLTDRYRITFLVFDFQIKHRKVFSLLGEGVVRPLTVSHFLIVWFLQIL